MAVKLRSSGKYQVDLRGAYVGVYTDERRAHDIEATGRVQLELGKPLRQVISELRGHTSDVTTDEFFEDWITSLPDAKVKAQSKLRYRNAWKRIPARVRQAPIASIDATTLRHVVKEVSDHYASNTVAQTVTLLKTLLIQASQEGICERPPTKLSNLPRTKPVRKPYALTREEHRLVVAAMPEYHQDLVNIWPLLAMRRGEIVALRWDDWDGDRMWVRRQYTNERVIGPLKSRDAGDERYVDLTDEAKAILEARPRVCDLIFPAQDLGYIGFSTLQKHLAKAGEAIGKDLWSHCLRHTGVSWMLWAKLPVTYIAARCGHTPQQLLSTYAHEIAESESTSLADYQRWLNGDGAGTQKSSDTPDQPE